MVECPCDVPSRSFYNTLEAAEKKMDWLEKYGCGGQCNSATHKLIMMDMETPEPEGQVFLKGEKGFHLELAKVMG